MYNQRAMPNEVTYRTIGTEIYSRNIDKGYARLYRYIANYEERVRVKN